MNRHIHNVIAAIAPHDSVERFEGLGVRVIRDTARFVSPNRIEAGAYGIRARRFVLATGSRAVLPPIPGLAEASPLTNETVFSLEVLPEHLLIIGGGPIGVEMAQAFRRLGSDVTLFDQATILPRDEPEAAAIARSTLLAEGVAILEGAEINSVRCGNGTVAIEFKVDGTTRIVEGSHILAAAGRAANTENLGLDKAGISFSRKGIDVDARLKTSNRKVFAIGDVAGGPQFTHIAAYHAGIVVRNALFWLPAKVDYSALPWVTYVDPEIAHVGLTESEARGKSGIVETVTLPFSENDRAQGTAYRRHHQACRRAAR